MDAKTAGGGRAAMRSYMRGLFEGRLEEDLVLPYPRIDPEERDSLDLLLDSFRKFADRSIDAAAIDERAQMPREVIDGLFEIGIMGMTIPEEFGGFGMSTAAYCRVMEEVNRRCAATATTIGGHESLGYKGILLFGTQEQKEKWLPGCASGELLASFALTEPASGSDAASLQATAIHDPVRKVYVLNGTKRWTTNGGLARLYTVFARTPDAPKRGKGAPISAFLVPRDLPGVSPGKEENKLGLKGSSTTDLVLENVEVPEENLLGEKGRGFKVAMEILNTGRLSLSACCLGAAKEMIDHSVAHAREREQFGRPIAEFEMIQDKIAEMMSDTYAMESMVYATAGLEGRDEPIDFSIESAICKIFATEALWRVINHAVQINGGNGFMREYPYERFLRDARVNMIFEGTNEILRHFIALAGMEGHGRRLREGGSAPGGAGRLESVGREVGREAAVIGELAGGLSGTVERVVREHRDRIVEREFLQQRIADAAIDLWAMSCVVARTDSIGTGGGAEAGERAVLLCRLFCAAARDRVRRNLLAVSENNDPDRSRAAELACADGGYRV